MNALQPPVFPFGQRFKTLQASLLNIVWWIGVWGLADTIIHLLFKGATLMELGVYITMILFVLLVVFVDPSMMSHM
jgi:hypothetical protein